MSRAPRRHAAGFTLLEILVALVVLGFLMAGLAQGVQFGLRAWGVQTRKIAIGGDMDSIDRALRRLIEQADPGDPTEQQPPFTGHPHTVSLVTRLPLEATGGPTRDALVALGVDGAHHLVLRSEPRPHAERLGPPPAARETVLLDNVDHVDFDYWTGGARGGWSSDWENPVLPDLVRVTIDFMKGDHRHWPALLASPERDRGNQ